MPIDQATLGKRLKEARLNCGITQEEAADALGVPRTAIVHIEAGNRSVSTLELAELARLYRRPVADFFSETPAASGQFTILGRVKDEFKNHPQAAKEIERLVAICKEGSALVHLLRSPAPVGPPEYTMPRPSSAMDAVEQGSHVAGEERRRLGIGHNPIPDMSDLITAQGIWASGAHLPDEIAGLFLSDPAIGLFIIVNFAHPRSRKRFSYAHEYCHALLDRSRELTVTTEANRSELIEVRANAFAAALLMPRNGVSAFLANRCKAGPSRFEQQVYDVATEKTGPQVKAQKRSSPGAQTITFEDVAALAHHFGVSYQAAAYRLKSLSVVNQDEVGSLLQKEPIGRDYLRLLHMLEDLEGNDNQKKPDRDLVRQVVHLAVEAYRREEISKGRLRDLSVLLKIPARDLLALAEAA